MWVQYVEVDACAVEDTKLNIMGTDPKKLKSNQRREMGMNTYCTPIVCLVLC